MNREVGNSRKTKRPIRKAKCVKKRKKQTENENSSANISAPLEFSFNSSNLKLEDWGLPESILRKYKENNVSQMFSWQAECLTTGNVLNGGNLVYSAPTSAGKTLVSEILLMKRIIETKKKGLLIVPFVSLAREKMFYFQNLLRDANIRVDGFMGGYSPPGGLKGVDLAISTIEKANSLVNRLLEEKTLDSFSIVVVDELHLVGDSSRGYLLELLLTKILFILNKNVQIVGMSATLPNLDLLAKWLKADLYKTDFRPIPLTETIKIGNDLYSHNFEKIRTISPLIHINNDGEQLVWLCLETLMNSHSVLVFCPTKNWCEKLAELISKEFYNLGKSSEKQKTANEIKIRSVLRSELNGEKLKGVLEQLKASPSGLDSILAKTICFGVAFHHAGLTFEERDIIEGFFKQGVLRVLIATSTLSSGVNLPARRVIVRCPFTFRNQMMDKLTYTQMIGRAGRKGIDVEGESILLCKESEKIKVSELIGSALAPVKSCLSLGDDDTENSLSSAMKRAIIEVVASGVADTEEKLRVYVSSTLLHASRSESSETSFEKCLHFLESHEFLRISNEEEENIENEKGISNFKYIATQLGSACLASSLSPDESLSVFKELAKARKSFVLENDLHLIYLIVPVYAAVSWPNLDWMNYLTLWESLTPSMKRVGDLVGVEERFLIRAMRGTLNNACSRQNNAISIHQRFYTALALNDLVNEVPLSTVSSKYGASKGMLQSLQQASSSFAGMVTLFCQRLSWSSLELLMSQFQNRLQFGVQRELIDLCRLYSLNGQRARLLYNAGLESVAAIANSSLANIETALHNARPFESKEKQREELGNKSFWILGQQGVTLRDAASIIHQEARDILQRDVGLVIVDWSSRRTSVFSNNSVSSKSAPTSKTNSDKANFDDNSAKSNFDDNNTKSNSDAKYVNEKLDTESSVYSSKSYSNAKSNSDTKYNNSKLNSDVSVEYAKSNSDAKYNNSKLNSDVSVDITNNKNILETTDLESSVSKTRRFGSKTKESKRVSWKLNDKDDNSFKSETRLSIFNQIKVKSQHQVSSHFEVEEERNFIASEDMFVDTLDIDERDLSLLEKNNMTTSSFSLPIKYSEDLNLHLSSCSENEIDDEKNENTKNHDFNSQNHTISDSFLENALTSHLTESRCNSTPIYSRERRQFSNESLVLSSDSEIEKSVDSESFEFESFNVIDVCSSICLFQEFIHEILTDVKSFSFSLAVVRTGDYKNECLIGKRFSSKVLTESFREVLIPDSSLAIAGISFSWHSNDVYFLSLSDRDDYLEDTLKPSERDKAITIETRIQQVKRIFDKSFNKTLCAFDIKEQLKVLFLSCEVWLKPSVRLLDPKIGAWMTDPGGRERNLPDLIAKFSPNIIPLLDTLGSSTGCGSVSLNPDAKTHYRNRSVAEALLVRRLMNDMKNSLVKQHLWKAFIDVEMPSLLSLLHMELNGVGFNESSCESHRYLITCRMTQIQNEAYSLAKRPFILKSHTDVSHVLYKELQLDPTGSKSTSKETLLKLKNTHILPSLLIEWRKLESSLTKVIIPMMREQRLHRDLNMKRLYTKVLFQSATGRLACTEPNLQNIPKKFEMGNKVDLNLRDAIVPQRNFLLLSADYSQLELRVLAHLSGDSSLSKILNEGGDVFKCIASLWKEKSVNDVTSEERTKCKAICYGMIYGIGSEALAEQLEVTEDEASEFMRSFKGTYPEINVYLEGVIEKCRSNGYVSTLGGRRRYLPEINNPSRISHVRLHAERQAVNSTIQGSAADISKRAMNQIHRKLSQNFPESFKPLRRKGRQNSPFSGAYLILQIHDELLYEVSSNSINEVSRIIREEMERAGKLSVKTPVNLQVGETWGSLKPFTL